MDRLSIVLANRNTLPFLKLCLRSLRENLAQKDHRILILDDASTDGSAEWLEENRARYGYELELHKGPERLGIVGAYNRLVSAAETPAVFMVHTDMYFARDADEATAQYLAPATICTCTRIEPPLYPGAPHKIIADFGMDPDGFREEEFLKLAAEKAQPDRYTEGIFAPVMCLKEDFLAVGGLDPAFAPQSKEDSDLFNRMAVAGCRFRQSWSAFCYHFSGRGSRKKDGTETDSMEWQATNRKNERNFIRRWGCMVHHDQFLKPIVPAPEPISLVALLGHEPDNVVPFLANLEPFFDEIIFVADGPQPESTKMIEAYVRQEEAPGPTLLQRDKIKVIGRALAADFAAQRNFAQERCRSEWVLHADLDERFDRTLLESLRDVIKSMRRTGKTVCGFPRLNYINGVLINDLPRHEWTPEGLAKARDKEMTEIKSLDPQFRLVRRDIRWRGKVHETPRPLGRNPDQVMLWTRAAIRHPKTLARQRVQDARYEAIAPGASLGPVSASYQTTSQQPKILMPASEYPPAKGYGLARYTSELAAALVSIGHEVHVVTSNYQGGRPSYIREGVHVHDMQRGPPVKHFDWVGDTVLGNIPLLELGLEVAQEHGPFDVLISHDWLAGHAAKALRSILGLPWVLFMHDTEVGKRDNRLTRPQAYIAEMEGWATKQADHVVTTSEFMRRELARTHKVSYSKITTIPCGVTPSRFQSRTEISDFRRVLTRDDERLIVYAGRLSPMKGVEDLVEAFLILASQSVKAKLVLAGEGVLRESIERRLKEARLSDRVYLTGWLSEKVLGALYQAADAVAVPSRYEPFGMVSLEAACCGAPVIAAEVGGLVEIIRRSGGSIVGVPASDPQKLAVAIQDVLSKPEHARVVGAQARKHVTATYCWTRAAAAVSSLLSQLREQNAQTRSEIASGRT